MPERFQSVASVERFHGKAVVWFESGGKMEVPSVMLKLRPVRIGMPLDRTGYLAFVEQSSYPYALEKMMRMQARRDHSQAEIRRALRMCAYPASVIDKAVSAFTQSGLLDDRRYAEQFVSGRSRRKGKRAIASELRFRGIEGSVAEEALSQVTEETELESAVQIISRMRRQQKPDDKIMASLLRRGFSYKTAKEAFDEHN